MVRLQSIPKLLIRWSMGNRYRYFPTHDHTWCYVGSEHLPGPHSNQSHSRPRRQAVLGDTGSADDRSNFEQFNRQANQQQNFPLNQRQHARKDGQAVSRHQHYFL